MEGIRHKQEDKKRLWSTLVGVYALCFALRGFEYFVLRTDETFWGEAFVHKLAGILIIYAVAKYDGRKLCDIGFRQERVLRGLLAGVGFGVLVFALAYLAEIAVLVMQRQFVAVRIYVTAYAPSGNVGNQTAWIFFLICIAGNIINVVMEEGLFRGLFPDMLEKEYSFLAGAVLSAVLFGLWHIMAPMRSCFDGTMDVSSFAANALLLIITSGLMGFKLSLLAKMTGSLYMGMGDHFINNALVNVLHVLSDTGADEWQVLRIAIAQSVSFAVVLACYVRDRP